MLDYHRFKTVSDLFMKGKTEEARLELTELQRRYIALCDENTTFKMQVQEYEDILYLARNLVLDNSFYWLITGSVKQGPFCPDCYDRDGLLMRLAGESDRYCPSCRKGFAAPPPSAGLAAAIAFDLLRDERTCASIPPKPQRKTKVIPFGK